MGRTWKKFLNFGLCKDGQKLEITSAVVIVTSELSCFDTAVICDWLKNPVPFFNRIRSKTESVRDLIIEFWSCLRQLQIARVKTSLDMS